MFGASGGMLMISNHNHSLKNKAKYLKRITQQKKRRWENSSYSSVKNIFLKPFANLFFNLDESFNLKSPRKK